MTKTNTPFHNPGETQRVLIGWSLLLSLVIGWICCSCLKHSGRACQHPLKGGLICFWVQTGTFCFLLVRRFHWDFALIGHLWVLECVLWSVNMKLTFYLRINIKDSESLFNTLTQEQNWRFSHLVTYTNLRYQPCMWADSSAAGLNACEAPMF